MVGYSYSSFISVYSCGTNFNGRKAIGSRFAKMIISKRTGCIIRKEDGK